MTVTALDKIGTRSPVPSPAQIGQATAVEQARAVAEVQAAVIVAQNVPRDMARAEQDMKDTCGRLSMAQRAFYSVPNRGTGPSVHLARELARIWGNVQYGVHELRRDDAAGVSEVQAFAWDVQTNTRSTRTFIAPHARMKGKERQALTDLNDIYLSNQNTGARAVRECIFAALPEWLVAEAQRLCRATLEAGEGKPIEQRRADAVAAFARGKVTEQQLVARVGKPVAQWTPQDVGSLEVLFDSLRNGETTKEEAFGEQQRVTAAEITGGQAPPPPPAADAGVPPVNRKQLTALHAGLTALGYTDRAEKLAFLSQELGRPLESTQDLTGNEASGLIDRIKAQEVRPAATNQGGPGEEWVPEPPADWQPEDEQR